MLPGFDAKPLQKAINALIDFFRKGLAGKDGSSQIGNQYPIAGAEVINLFNIILQQELTPQRIRRSAGGSSTSDDTDVLLKVFEYAQGDGHKNFRLAQTGYGYRSEAPLAITNSNITLHADDHLYSKQTTKSSLLVISGTASVTGEIEGVSIIASRPIVFDGNAPNITGYNYLTAPESDRDHSACFVRWVKNFYAKGVIFRNGLVNSFRAYQPRGIILEDCRGSMASWDNGLSIDFDPQDFDPLNPDTWANAVLFNCTGDRNIGFGLTSYGATNTRMVGRVLAYLNGNNDPTRNPGPGGGVSLELNGSIDRDYRGLAENLVCIGNLGRGAFISATGTKLIGRGSIESSKIPTAYTTNPERYGHGVAIFGAKGIVIGIPVSTSERHGVYGLAVSGRMLGLEITGSVAGSAQRGVQLQGVDSFKSSGEYRFNGLQVGATQVDAINIDNTGAAFNQGLGRVEVTGRFDSNGGSAVRTQYVADVIYRDITGKDSNLNHAAQSAVYADNCGYVEMTNISHRGANVTTIANAGAGNTRAMIDGVTGDATSQLFSNAAANISTSTKSQKRTSLGGTGYPVTLTQASYHQVELDVALSGTPVINLPAIATAGDEIRFTRTGNSTGPSCTVTDGVLSFPLTTSTTVDVVRTTSGAWRVTSRGTTF